jgi:hypothetical protein
MTVRTPGEPGDAPHAENRAPAASFAGGRRRLRRAARGGEFYWVN